MQLTNDIQDWILIVLFWGLMVLRVWALVDCLIRKAAAFPAAGKLTKPAWALLTGLSVLIGYFFAGPVDFLGLAFVVVSMVYLADVRPAVREVSGGNRW